MDPRERLTATEALNHPFFDPERQGENDLDLTDRK
jgi:serine/threonine protein kinase